MSNQLFSIAMALIFELQYRQGRLSRPVPTSFPETGAHNTPNSDYDTLFNIFQSCHIARYDVLMDLGCVKRRVINLWLSRKLRNTIEGDEAFQTCA